MTNFIDNQWASMAYNLNYKSTLDTLGRELTVDLDYSNYSGQAFDDMETHFFNKQGNENAIPLILRSDIPSNVEIKSGKADYVHPINKDTKIEAGIKTSFVTTDNNVKWETYNEGSWNVDRGRTNHFQYKENLNAAYINIHTQYKKFGFQLGLRAEQTIAKGNLITENLQKPDTSYLNFFPSVFVSQKISEKNQVTYSYSKRIDRPSYQNLNPFIYFLDPYAYFQGNPFLKPQYTHSFQVAHTYDGKFITTLGYSNTSNVMQQVTEQNDETKVTKATMTNLDNFKNLSLGINAPVTIAKWWTTNNNLSFYYKEYKSRYLDGEINNTGFSWTLNSNHNFTLPRDFSAELSGMYLSPNVEGIIKIRSMYVVNMGIQKNLWDKKANIKLNVNDVFNIMKFRGTIDYQNQHLNILGKWESRLARITFTYRFGKEDIKPARRRSSGAESEQNRVNMGGN
ncbi:MAG TPA: outer membrane beta-barrel family protein [Cytophagales bacterium]|nr:outer membrane beta-barrel family protein [Cytophagales bacterium]